MTVESFLDGKVLLHPGDCLEVLKTLEPNSIDSVVTDPPYGLEFMGKAWDHGVPGLAYWKLIFRTLKPGGHLLAFSGTRTYHRMACAIEDAGFEIRDQIGWAYGSGFPKSLDVSKAIDNAAGARRPTIATEKVRDIRNGHGRGNGDGINAAGREGPVYMQRAITAPATEDALRWQGWGTALKPAWEPIVLGRKPLIGTVAQNIAEHGTGAINIDGCRVGNDSTVRQNHGGTGNPDQWRTGNGADFTSGSQLGRWPANIVHDGSEEVVAAFPDAPGRQYSTGPQYDRKTALVYGKFAGVIAHEPRSDSGSAARFFYTAKADSDDRLGSKHPTVKPRDLMQWLARLVTPPGGLVLDPFAGTGTTGEAAFREGFRSVLIEREAEYQADIRRRMAHILAGPDERKRVIAKAKHGDKPMTDGLFGLLQAGEP